MIFKGRPNTPPLSLMILVMISMPSLTWVPCTTEPGGDWAMLTPMAMGSAASAAAAPMASRVEHEAATRRGSFKVDFSFKNGHEAAGGNGRASSRERVCQYG